MKIDRKKISNILFVVLLLLFFIPSTRGMMQILLTRIFSMSPSVENRENPKKIASYQWKLQGITTGSLNAQKLEGKIILVNYWATWCPPCIAEMPSLQELYDVYKEKVVFLFITNEVDEDVHTFMNAKEYNFPVYRSLSESPKPLVHKTIPQTYLLDQEGKIIIDETGAADWNSKKVHAIIDQLIAQHP